MQPTAAVDHWTNQNFVDGVADEASALAGADVNYVRVDPAQRTVYLSLHNPAAGLIDQLSDRFGATVQIETAANSYGRIKQVWNDIERNVSVWRDAGVLVAELSATEDGYLSVSVASNPSIAQSKFDADYGTGIIRVSPYNTGPIVNDSYRYSDTAPWNGGDLIYTNTGGVASGCTAGIPVEDATGQDYMLTAAHCVNSGDVVKNGYVTHTCSITCTSQIHGSTTTIGTCCYKQDNPNHDGTHDAALIQANTSSLDFICDWSCSYTAYQTSAGNNYVGNEVCISGGYDGERCGIIIRDANVSNCAWQAGPPLYWSNCRNDVVKGSRDDGNWVAGQEDSGSPVFSWSGSQVVPLGSYVAHSGSATCPSAAIDPTYRACGTVAYWIAIKPILNQWGLQINKDGQ
jgi:hypothetical protein